MKIYSSPKTGKSTFCRSHSQFIDGDIILRDIICKKFKIKKKSIDMNKFGEFILGLYVIDKLLIESCYTEYMYWLKSYHGDVLFGTRRFMWIADKIYLETNASHIRPESLINAEIFSASKWNLNYNKLSNKYISEILT